MNYPGLARAFKARVPSLKISAFNEKWHFFVYLSDSHTLIWAIFFCIKINIEWRLKSSESISDYIVNIPQMSILLHNLKLFIHLNFQVQKKQCHQWNKDLANFQLLLCCSRIKRTFKERSLRSPASDQWNSKCPNSSSKLVWSSKFQYWEIQAYFLKKIN